MTLHTKISLIKSVLRIMGYALLIAYDDTILTVGTSFISNIQPLCGPCNSSKGAKTTDYRRTT
jgi:5-methylcytosine-specific restriction endonuclease McrA